MKTILDTLKGISAYPIPLRTLVETAELRGVTLNGEAMQDTMVSKAYTLAKADLFLWLSLAPNITQGGQSYSFSDEQREQFRNQAKSLYEECGEQNDAITAKPTYGYKGTHL